jgi:hypothetical protein
MLTIEIQLALERQMRLARQVLDQVIGAGLSGPLQRLAKAVITEGIVQVIGAGSGRFPLEAQPDIEFHLLGNRAFGFADAQADLRAISQDLEQAIHRAPVITHC